VGRTAHEVGRLLQRLVVVERHDDDRLVALARDDDRLAVVYHRVARLGVACAAIAVGHRPHRPIVQIYVMVAVVGQVPYRDPHPPGFVTLISRSPESLSRARRRSPASSRTIRRSRSTDPLLVLASTR